MKRTFLRAKIHRAIVTEADLDYVGSLTLDARLMEAAGLSPYERIEIYNVTRGTRLATYLIEGEPGRGDCCVNGAAAHLCRRGDRVILCAYADLEPEEAAGHRPRVVLIGDTNREFEIVTEEEARTRA